MQQRTLGSKGQALSALGMGCNNFGMRIDADQTEAVVLSAIDAGITHFDTAEMYGEGASEQYLGRAVRGKRDQVTIATKFLPRPDPENFRPGDLTRHAIAAAETSLVRLDTDRIDLFYQHYHDEQAPLEELFDAFAQLVEAGKIRESALSNVDGPQLAAAADLSAARPDSVLRGVQVEWNLLNRAVEESVVPVARRSDIGVIPYFPLASGLLTGKYRGGEYPEGSRFAAMPYFANVATPENLALVDKLTDVAAQTDRTLVELAIGWLLAQDTVVSVIAGATTPEQVKANAAAVESPLTAAELAAIEDALS